MPWTNSGTMAASTMATPSVRNWWTLKMAGRSPVLPPGPTAAPWPLGPSRLAPGSAPPTVDSIADTGRLPDQPGRAEDQRHEEDDERIRLDVVRRNVARQELLRDRHGQRGDHSA